MTQAHLDARNFVNQEVIPVGMTDRVMSAGVAGDGVRARPHRPRLSLRARRRAPRDLTPDDVTGVVVHTDLRRTGWFRVQRRPDQPLPRRDRVELPRQRLRHPDRLPPA
ncbi:MAG: hypothetical protein R2695_00575 [Acidimicrobiales bacterium]